MDPERERIQADLRGLVKGDVRCDDVFLQLYATRRQHLRNQAAGRGPPAHAGRRRGLRRIRRRKPPADPSPRRRHGPGRRIAGRAAWCSTSPATCGACSTTGDDRVRVQPGIVHAQLNEFLRPSGRQFGPDPAMSSVTTMGSVIAIDAGGSHWLKYGSARRHVLEPANRAGRRRGAGSRPRAARRRREPTPNRRSGQLVASLADLLRRECRHDPRPSAAKRGQSLRLSLSTCSPTDSSTWPAARRLRRNAGPDHRSHAWPRSRCPSIAAWRCCCSIAWKARPGR